MAENVPESVSVVQLSIAQYSVYGYNDIQSTMTGCDAGGLGFYMLFGKNSLSKPAGGREPFRIASVRQINAGYHYLCWLNMQLSMC